MLIEEPESEFLITNSILKMVGIDVDQQLILKAKQLNASPDVLMNGLSMGGITSSISNGDDIGNDRINEPMVDDICQESLQKNFKIFCNKAAEAVPDDKKRLW